MTEIQRVTGMQDILPDERDYWDAVESKAIELARRYGFQRIDIPIIEYSQLFSRGVGTASDFFVKKEMYTIEEEDGTSITLRPEFTAGMVRAYIENGMASWPQPTKLYTIGPLFRRERPQAGRFRQHSQINPEILGESDPAADLEIMLFAKNLHRELGYKELAFQLNSTGCPICKPNYIEHLVEYLSKYKEALSEIDLERLKRNPLRVLDSKSEGMDEILDEAPHIIDFLCNDCSSHFQELLTYLDRLGEAYSINFRLVRGIDYYTKTVFELWDEAIGAQAALCGGGRYDGLAEAIGGPPTPGVGVGIGIDRIVIGMQSQGIPVSEPSKTTILLAHFGGETKIHAISLVDHLRQAGVGARIAFARNRRSLKSQMREADKHGVRYAAIIGEDEMTESIVTIRDMESGEQQAVPNDDLVPWLKNRI